MRLFWHVYLVQALILLTVAFNTFIYRSTPTMIANTVFTLRETAIAAKEYWADVLNHAVYKELENNFPDGYGDDPEEQWVVPTWFEDPRGGTKVYCTEIGCTVWNLTDAGDSQYTTIPTPCPDVVSVRLPDPKLELQSVSEAAILSYARQDANIASFKLTEALREGTWGDVNIYPLNINITQTASGIDVRGESQIDIRIPTDVNIVHTSTQEFVAGISVEYVTAEARCECKNKSTGTYETLATYEVNRALYHFVTEDSNTGDIATDRAMLYVQWFSSRTTVTPADPSNYESCRMVVP